MGFGGVDIVRGRGPVGEEVEEPHCQFQMGHELSRVKRDASIEEQGRL